MRHWKKYVLLATGFALMLPMTAMADQNTVTVEVKNVKGGIISAWYLDDKGVTKYIPISEKTEVPKGQTIYLGGGYDYTEWTHQYGISYIESRPKKITVINKDGTREETDLEKFTADEDCTIEPEYQWTVNHEGYSNNVSGYWIYSDNDLYYSPAKVDVKVKAFKDNREIKFSDLKNVTLGAIDEAQNPEYLDEFELTSTGFRSKKTLPLGLYRIPIHYQLEDGSYEDTPLVVQIGMEVYSGDETMAVFKEDDGSIYPLWDVHNDQMPLHHSDIGTGTYDKAYPEYYFDMNKTSADDLAKIAKKLEKEANRGVSHIAGYTWTDVITDRNGNVLDGNSTKKMKDIYNPDYEALRLGHVHKKGEKVLKPVVVEPLSKNEIIYTDSFITENGNRYYYDSNGKLAKNQWVKDTLGEVFCGEDGAIVTNGIAGISMDDGLYFVGEDGTVNKDKNDAVKNGFITYTVVNGKVTELKVEEVATPSNAASVKDLADGLQIAGSQLDAGKRTEYADKLSDGISSLSAAEKTKLDDAVIEKVDDLLCEIYGVSAKVEPDSEDGVDEAMVISASDVDVKGVLAAAGITSENAGSEVQVKLTQLAASASNATAANASKRVLKFKAELYVDGIPVQLKAPIIFKITLPEAVRSQYPATSYTFKVEHVKNDGTTETIDPSLSEDNTVMSIRTNSFSTFELIATKKANSSSFGHSSSYGKNRSGRHAAKQPLIGKWMKDANGWWYRFYNTSWPKNQWIELEWNGVTSWYYFDANGYMVTGWKKDGDQWYYLNPNSDGTMGAMVTGWKKIDNIWYYFNTVAGNPKGAMLKNTTTPDGYQVGADGAWVK